MASGISAAKSIQKQHFSLIYYRARRSSKPINNHQCNYNY
uniref:Uncharacterized protein n=1 Tax=Anguilla anguilla TaxID=7936 RepID=A0A0E9U6U1_ANGAN